jgi:hypothetical protein
MKNIIDKLSQLRNFISEENKKGNIDWEYFNYITNQLHIIGDLVEDFNKDKFGITEVEALTKLDRIDDFGVVNYNQARNLVKEIYTPMKQNLIVEMTLEEISKALGKNIKIKGENK